MTDQPVDLDHRHVSASIHSAAGLVQSEPLVIESGQGCTLTDADGRPTSTASHRCGATFMGTGTRRSMRRHRPARPGRTLNHARPDHRAGTDLAAPPSEIAPPGLQRYFDCSFRSDCDEIALKMAFQYWHAAGWPAQASTSSSPSSTPTTANTSGAVSVGGIDLFHSMYRPLLFDSFQVPAGNADALADVLEIHGEESPLSSSEPLFQAHADQGSAPRLPEGGSQAL